MTRVCKRHKKGIINDILSFVLIKFVCDQFCQFIRKISSFLEKIIYNYFITSSQIKRFINATNNLSATFHLFKKYQFF